MSQTVKISYSGSSQFANSLAACIRAKGGEVTWERPGEIPGTDEIVTDVVIDLRVSSTDDPFKAGAIAAARAGIAMFNERFPGKGRALILENNNNAHQ